MIYLNLEEDCFGYLMIIKKMKYKMRFLWKLKVSIKSSQLVDRQREMFKLA